MAYSTQPSSDTNNDQKTVTRHKHDINNPKKFKDSPTDATDNSRIKQLYKIHDHLHIKITFCLDAHLHLPPFTIDILFCSSECVVSNK
jgi:hypothetical protein